MFLQLVPRKILIYVIGSGSNLLIRDGGLSGIVVKLNNGFNDFFYDKQKKIIKVGCGLKNINFIKYCLKNCIGILNFFLGFQELLGVL